MDMGKLVLGILADPTKIDGFIEQYKPGIDSIASALAPMLEKIGDYRNRRVVDNFKFFTDNGFTRDEAIILILGGEPAIKEQLDKRRK